MVPDRMEAHVGIPPEITTILTRELILRKWCRDRRHFLHCWVHIHPQILLCGRVEWIPLQRLHCLLTLVWVNPAPRFMAPNKGSPDARKEIFQLPVLLHIDSHHTEDVCGIS